MTLRTLGTNVNALNNAYVGKTLVEKNVLDYGADRTGVTDSTAAFVAALAAGNAVYAPAGTYLVGQVPLGSGQQLRGDGPGRTIITSNTNLDGVIWGAGTLASRATGVVVRDLSVNCITNTGTSQAAVTFTYCDQSVIRNVEASNAWINGVEVFYSTTVRVQDCNIHDNRTFALLVYQSADCVISGNYIHDHTFAGRSHLGIQFKSSQRCSAINNKISNIAGYGIYTWSDYTGSGAFINDYLGNPLVDKDHQIIGNVIRNCTAGAFAGIGINLNGSTVRATTEAGAGHQIIGNIIDTTASDAIELANTTGAKVTGNTVRNSAAVGVSCTGTSQNAAITGNTVTASDQGVLLAGATYCTVTGNNIRDLLVSASNLAAAVKLTSGTDAGGSTVYASYNQIVGNTISDSRSGASRHKRGIYEDNASCVGNVIVFNQSINSQLGDVTTTGAGVYMNNGAATPQVARIPQVQAFTATGTWTKPAGISTVKVVCIGPGGGGGSGRRGAAASTRVGGGGGAGGGVTEWTLDASLLGATEAVTIANSGGVGGAAVTADDTSGNNGSTPASTTFGAHAIAFGGGGGGGGTASVGTAGAAGGGRWFGAAGGAAASNGGTASGGSPGGGGGGGVSAADALTAAGTGAISPGRSVTAAAAGVSPGGAGTAGTDSPAGEGQLGGSGAGGASSITGAAGAGGKGGLYGAGGGGGGASLNGNNSGAGGNGGAGFCLVISF